MFVFPAIAQEILRALMAAENLGTPITMQEATRRWVGGSTWDELVDRDYIDRFNAQGVLVTLSGRKWLEERRPSS